MELGKKIRQLRFKAGLTQEQLAEKLGIGPQSVSKWENAVAMPDITTLPLLAEVFGVSIDDLFDLTAEQRLNRIENRMDAEEELTQDVFREYEDFLKTQMNDETHQKRATSLIAYLYWHRMNAEGKKAARYAREAIRRAPGEKDCQWILQKAEGHAAWDWNIANHTRAINFYRELAEANPDVTLPYMYLIDNLIADHRTQEAAAYLQRVCQRTVRRHDQRHVPAAGSHAPGQRLHDIVLIDTDAAVHGMVLQRDGRGNDSSAERGRGLILVADGAAFRGMLRAEAGRQNRGRMAMILGAQRSCHVPGYIHPLTALVVQAEAA